MSKHVLFCLQRLDENIKCLITDETYRQVMAGSERITASWKLERVAMWTKGAIERLDILVDEQTRRQIMANCGSACALAGQKKAMKTGAKRAQYPTLDAFLEAEFVCAPQRGARFFRGGGKLYQVYTPRAYSLRCYCPLLRKLPDEETVSATYCQCSRAFVQKTWQAILERPVNVELVESCVCGARECKFAIEL